MNSSPSYSLLNDPIYYGAVAVFAALATALPALVGGAWFLLVAQTVALWLLLLVPLRRGLARPALVVLLIWGSAQALTLFAVTLLAPAAADRALGNGFDYRQALLLWHYTDAPLPGGLRTEPWARLIEVTGVALGSLLAGGLVGVGFLVGAVNRFAFGAAALYAGSETAAGLLGGLMPWALLRIGGYIGLVATLSLVGYTGEWSPGGWPRGRRRLFRLSLALVAAALALEWAAG